MTLLDAQGNPIITAEIDRCPQCGSRNLYDQTGFGGYWKKLCNHCGHILASGREVINDE